ncbi:LOW QUALITY PROTEIN: fat-like cadherin-related tumor suppressor homolog [Clytia hemisphaerica]
MNTLLFALILGLLCALTTINCFPEIGIHAGIKENVQATSTGWLTLNDWWVDDDETDDSFKSSYKNDLVLESKTFVKIPITGIYHVSASIPIFSINATAGGKFTLAMVNGESLDSDSLSLQSTIKEGTGDLTTLVISGFCEYGAGEMVSFRVFSENDDSFYVTPGSKMSIHYIGITQTAPAFLVQVDQDYTIAAPSGEIVKPYLTSGRAKLFTYLTGLLPLSGTYVTACEGIFYLAANIMLEAGAGTYTLEVLINSQVSASYITTTTTPGGIIPLSVFESMKVGKGVVISLRLKADASGNPVKVLKYSSWSIGFIGAAVFGLQEFAVFLQLPLTVGNSDYNYLKVDLQNSRNNINTLNNRGQFVQPDNSRFLLNNQRFNVEERANFFYVSADIHISGASEDIEVVIPVSLEKDEANLAYKGLSSRVKKVANEAKTITISATMVVADAQFLSLYVKAHDGKQIKVESNSYISFIQMRYLTSSFSVKSPSIFPRTFTDNQWNDATGPYLAEEKGSFAFAGDYDVVTGKFQASHTGIHMVQANLKFTTSGCNSSAELLEANLAIDNKVDPYNGFYSMVQAPQATAALRFYGALYLISGQQLGLKVRLSNCGNPTYTMLGQWGASYIGTSYITPAFMGIKPADNVFTPVTQQFLNVSTNPRVSGSSAVFSTDDQFDGNAYTAMEDAIFIVSANALVGNMQCTANTYVAIRLLVTGKDNEGGTTVFTDKDINIRDVKYVTNNQNTTLSLSTSLRLKDGESVKVEFIESTVFPEDSVTTGTSACTAITLVRGSSFSVIRWSGSEEISAEGYQNAGFLARDNSGNLINTNDWDTFATNSLRYATGNPGFFAISNSLIVRDSAFSVNLIAKAGVYYVSGSITLLFDNILASNTYEMAVLLNDDYETGISSTIYYRGSEYVTLSFAGFVYLMYGQSTSTVNLKVKGQNNYYIYKGSTFSIIKLQPDYKTPGFVTEIQSQTLTYDANNTVLLDEWVAKNSKGLTVNNIGYDHATSRYTIQQTGFYFIDINTILNPNSTTVPDTYELEMVRIRNSTNETVFNTEQSIAGFHTTIISGIYRLTADDVIHLRIKSASATALNGTTLAGGYSLYFTQSSRDFRGFRSALGTNYQGSGIVDGWINSEPIEHYKGESTNATVRIIFREGQYTVSFHPVFTGGAKEDYTAMIKVNGQTRMTGKMYGRDVDIPLSGTFKLALNDSITFEVSGTDTPELTTATTRSLAYIAPLSTVSGGLSLYKKSDTVVTAFTAVVNGLYGDGDDGYFLDDNSTLVNNEAIAIVKPGFYRINAHVMITNAGSASNFVLETLITNIERNLEVFKSVLRLENTKTGTLIISGVVPLRKFDNIQFKVTSSESSSFTILQDSTTSIVVLDDNTGPTQCEEVRVFLQDLPSFQRLQIRENITYTCTVVGNKVADAFEWYKDGVLMAGETTPELVIDNLSLNKSGVYYCRGKFFDVFAQTNNATLEVYNPYPTANATEGKGYAYVVEENKPSMLLVTFEVEAFMFAPKDTQANISIQIITGDVNGDFYFSMPTNTTINMYTSRPLDYENIEFYTLTLRATNLEEPGVSGKPGPYLYDFQVNVTVLNINDNEPIFAENPFIMNIPEDQPVGSTVAIITATDPDGDSMNYTMYSNISLPYFNINATSGEVYIISELDRESIVNHSLFIVAHDGIHKAVTELLLVVTDVNDNYPQFVDSSFVLSLAEMTYAPSVILKAIATDPDLGNNSTLTYTILEGNDEGKFDINAITGNISLVNSLDFEKTQSYFLVISVTDQGTPTTKTSQTNLTVSINVIDNNDNNPIFQQSLYQTTISEEFPINDVVISVKAIDADGSAVHNTVNYTIFDPLAQQYFQIMENGSIVLVQNLDYNEHQEFRFPVQSNDGKLNTHRHLTTTVVIKITDVNNQAPVIEPSVYNITISEGTSVGTSIGHINASDVDSVGILTYGANGDDSGKFMIMSTTGAIHLKTHLDYENVADRLLTFNATVTDGVAMATALVNIHVTDANDNEPVFTQKYYRGSLREDSLAGFSILTVSASDNDATNTNESAIRYSIETDVANPSTQLFDIDINSGEINLRMNNSLDYEVMNKHQFKVIATDMGDIYQLSGYTTVIIDVIDVNDNKPDMLTGTQTINVKESHLVNTPLVAFIARDNDTSPTLTYHIVSGNDNNTFKINGHYLELNNSLDYETQTSYTVTVVARDQDNLESGVAIVKINVVKVNEHRPVFTTQYIRKEVFENSGLHALVDLNATDDDMPLSTIKYSLLNTSDFVIDINTGVISNVVELDYEGKNSYSLVAIASDQDTPYYLQQQTLVDIIVLDRNDDAPYFNPTNIEMKISEKAPVGMIIATLKAYDNDTATEDLTFGADTIEPKFFSLDSNTGVVTLNNQIDLEAPESGNYEMVFYVFDGVNMSPVNCTVKVSVVAVNDNEPIFEKDEYVIYMKENQNIGTAVVTVLATDKDTNPLQGDRIYSIVPDVEDAANFTIDQTRVITTTQVFDFEQINQYAFIVQANNTGAKDPLTGRALVRVYIEDENDNDPIPAESSIHINITESTTIGSLVIVIRATDADSTTNAELSYALSNSTMFTINNVGEIRLKGQLDIFVQETYNLQVTITDGGTPQRSAVVNVTIDILQAQGSVSLADMRREDIPEDIAVGSFVLLVNSTTRSGKVSYQLVPNQDSVNFKLNSTTGELTTATQFDFETKRFYLFQVMVVDSAANMTGRTQILINILDINDNVPVITSLKLVYNISEATRITSQIASFGYTDADSGRNGDVDFEIIGGDGNGTFAVDKAGHVTLVTPLDHRVKNQYTLLVKGEDDGLPAPLHSNITITINVFKANVDFNVLVFNQSYYHVCVDEEQAHQNFITVSAVNQNPLSSTKVTYSFAASTSADIQAIFSLNSTTGEMSCTNALDYETKKSFEIVVVATNDEGYRDTSVVEVCVNDVNDNPYTFKEDNIVLNLTESTPVDTLIYRLVVLDNDTIDSGSRSFAVNNGVIRVDSKGFVYLNQQLDYETTKQHTSVVTVRFSSTADDTATITINVRDWNDHHPVFTPTTVSVTVQEDAAIGSIIGSVSASDNDETNPNNLRNYDLISTSDLFAVITNGSIQVKNDLSITQNNTEIELVVKARDLGYLQLIGTINVHITIIDTNNNRPIFESTYYENRISEEAPVNSKVLCVKATDGDFNIGSIVTYILYDPMDHFKINSTTGEIHVKQVLDYESKQEYTMHVEAVDDQGLKSAVNATVVIFLVDVNDNLPTFNLTMYARNVTESTSIGTSLLEFEAYDNDLTGDSLTFTLVANKDSETFRVAGRDLQLKLALDYETQRQFTFLVEVTDSATKQLYGRSLVVIYVINENDVAPVWNENPYNVTISEAHLVNQLVVEISATDADEDNLIYTINPTGTDNKFTITTSNNMGQITLAQSVDYDVKKLYKFQVTVSDGNFNVNVDVEVHITPVNKPEPSFNRTVYVVDIYENTTVNTAIIDFSFNNVIAPYTTLIFNEAEGTDNFNIVIASNTATNGQITTKVLYDHDLKSQYVFTITITDARGREGHSTVIVNVLNNNDLCPVVLPATQIVRITEPTIDNTVVAVVRASDKDSDSLSFSLVNTTDNILNGMFKIDAFGGIRANGMIDIENQTIAELTVFVSDGNCVKNATIIVYVNPVTACPVCKTYQFIEPVYRASILEGKTQVGLITVQTNRHSMTNYSITDGTALGFVSIGDTTGKIDVNVAFNYEVRQSLEFYVYGVSSIVQNPDEVVTMRARVIITVLDVDDNCPTYDTPVVMNMNYSSPIEAGTIVGRVRLSDDDTEHNHTLTVTDNVNFMIEQNGNIKTTQVLQSLVEKYYNFNVSATNPRCNVVSQVALTLEVCPEPMTYMFTDNGNYEETVFENKTVGTFFNMVLRIQGSYSPVTYSIVENSALTLFNITNSGSDTATIALQSGLDYETARKHIFTVKATIMNIFEAHATVIINVLDIPDECPNLPATMTIKYRGNPDINDVIGKVTATGIDSALLYTINANNELTINSATGELSTKKSFPYSYDQTTTYQVSAAANNNCTSAKTTVSLDLKTCTNPEDYQFTKAKYVRTYNETRPLGYLFSVSIRKVTLSRTYAIVYPAGAVERYSINSTTGEISLVQNLDYEAASVEHFQVNATFSDGVVSVAEVTIYILDVNDNCPQFIASSPTTIYITEPLEQGLWITQTLVTDNDSDAVNQHVFALTGDAKFTINQKGVITVKQDYVSDRAVAKFTHNLTVTITDGTCAPRVHSVDVVIFKVLLQEYQFSRPFFKYEISEDQTTPHVIDCFKNLYNHTGVYRLKFSNSTCFSLSSNGDLRLIKPLDYEAYTHHYIDVEVEYSNGFVAHSGVVIVVRNVNDNKPQTFPYPSAATINPSFARHTMVGEIDVVDADRERTDGNTFVFSIDGGDPKGIFAISQTGQIYTKRCMTGTDIGIYDLRIKVNDGRFDVYESMPVKVFDVGDTNFAKSCPVSCSDFGNPSNYMFNEGIKMVSLPENTMVGSPILTVDINAFPNATFALDAHAAGYFSINADNGTIYLNRSLNYEISRVHYFGVTANIQSRANGVMVTSNVAIMVMVQNVEDNEPMVTAPSTVSISELTVPGTIVGYLKVKDADTMISQIEFNITSPHPEALEVNGHGELIARNLSGVQHNTNIQVNYRVTDSLHSTTGIIVFRVVDVNNNVPLFDKKIYTFNVDENAVTTVGSVSATDADVTQSSVRYSIDATSSVLFMINATSGVLSTRTNLDYETAKMHHVTLMATDNGGYVGVAVAHINVKNKNDNTPSFVSSSSSFAVSVNENTAVGALIQWIHVEDKDAGTSLSFSFNQVQPYFNIDNSGVVTLTKALYTSSDNEYIMAFTVTDGVAPISGVLTVSVVRGSIDKCPGLTGFNVKNINVDENTAPTSVILDLSSLVISAHHQYKFTLENGSPANFEIVNSNLRLKSAIDYETQKTYTFNVVAEDVTRNTTTVLPLTVNVVDIDESTPTITTTDINVSEFTQVGSIVGMVIATDTDGSAKIAFELTNGDGTFTVNTKTGAVTLAKAVDGAVQSSYRLEICATSSGVRTCKNITTTVQNTNSNAPTFGVTTMTISISHNTTVGTVISSKSATDADGGAMTYTINALGDATVTEIFEVDAATGHIKVVRSPLVPGEYKFFLIATDGVLETCIPVTIVVPVDTSNATPPHFKTTAYSATIMTDAAVVLRVEALDPPDTRSLKYTIQSGNTDDSFEIDESTGSISKVTGKTLTVGTMYSLTVAATNTRSNLTGTAPVYIAVGSSIEASPSESFVQESSATSLLLNVSLSGFQEQHVVAYVIIGQEYPSNVDVSVQTSQEPVTYHLAFNSTQTTTYRYRLYNVARIPIATVTSTRTRRSLEKAEATSLLYRVGAQTPCPSTEKYCNGPLTTGNRYRFFVAAIYNTPGVTNGVQVNSPATPAALTIGPNIGALGGQQSVHVNALVIWIVALVVMGTLFWLAILALAIVLCYKRRYLHDKAYDLGYNGPPIPNSGNAYAFDNKGAKINEGSPIHYSEVATIADRRASVPDQQTKINITHAPVVLDSPEHSPQLKTNLKTYEDTVTTSTFSQEFETRSANLKFGDENPEWESMDIQLRIDPTGERDPVITRKETKKEEEHPGIQVPEPPVAPVVNTQTSVTEITTTTTTIQQVVNENGDVIEEKVVDQTTTDELSRV